MSSVLFGWMTTLFVIWRVTSPDFLGLLAWCFYLVALRTPSSFPMFSILTALGCEDVPLFFCLFVILTTSCTCLGVLFLHLEIALYDILKTLLMTSTWTFSPFSISGIIYLVFSRHFIDHRHSIHAVLLFYLCHCLNFPINLPYLLAPKMFLSLDHVLVRFSMEIFSGLTEIWFPTFWFGFSPA